MPTTSQGTVSKIKKQFDELGHVKGLPRRKFCFVDEDSEVNALLEREENSTASAK